MKLKKIASLALAGIMAVSMLAGCKSNPADPETPTDPTTPATGVSTTFASYLTGDRIKFADNSTYQKYLSDAITDADLDYKTIGSVSGTKQVTDDVYSSIVDDFSANVVNFVNDYDAISGLNTKVGNNSDATYIIVYTVDGMYSQNIALKSVADQLDTNLSNSYFVNYNTVGGKQYNYDYTGSVSMQKVEDGSASAWYVLVTVSIDAAEAKQ